MKIKTGKTKDKTFHLSCIIKHEDSERLKLLGDGKISIGMRNLLDSVRDEIDKTLKRKTSCRKKKEPSIN